MTTHAISSVVEKVLETAKNSSRADVRVCTEDNLPYGKVFQQGDVYIRRLPLSEVSKFKLTPRQSRQVAPGTTIGSQHVVREGTAKLFDRPASNELDGPVIVAEEGFYLEHPKHGHFDCTGLPGCYVVTGQQDLAAEGIRRARD